MITVPARLENNQLSLLGGRYALSFSELDERLPSQGTDGVVIAGSIVEGIGNHLSDLDVYVISEARPAMREIDPRKHHWLYFGDDNNSVTVTDQGELHQIFDYREVRGPALDIEFWTEDELDGLLAEVDAAYHAVMRHAFRAGRFSYRKAGFLHRMLNGLVYRGSSAISRFRGQLDVAKLCYLLYRQYAGGYPALRDIAGAWYAEHYDLAVYSVREHAMDQVMALTFLELQTNPNMKWIFDKVQRLADESAGVREQFVEFTGLPARTRSDKQAIVLLGLDLIDAVFDRCRILLDTNRAFMTTAEAIRITNADRAARAADNEEFELQLVYRLKMYERGHPTCAELLRRHEPAEA